MGSTVVNYDDERFQKVEAEEKETKSEIGKSYDDMIGKSDKFYQDQINASKEWADKQADLQQQQTDFTIEQIEQQKEQSRKDYLKEQSGAYVDWQKQSNQYGAEAERMAAAGLDRTGYSETSQVNMYNAYQNRVATAREVFAQATLQYDNGIKEARLKNSAALAEIYAKAYQQQLELGLQGFQYKNQLILDKTNKMLEVDQMYHGRWQDVLQQINTENALAEQKRQADLADKRAKAQLAEQKRQFDAQMAYQKEQDAIKQSQIKASGSSSSKNSKAIAATKQKVLSVTQPVKKQSSKSSEIVIVNSPLTAKGAAEKVASGELVVTKQEGNKVWVARNPNYTKGQSTLDKYTNLAKFANGR